MCPLAGDLPARGSVWAILEDPGQRERGVVLARMRVQGAAAASLILSELLLRSYSRDHEDEADKEGQSLASAAGYMTGGGNMAAIHLANAVGGNLFLGFISAVAFATILAVVAGLTLLGENRDKIDGIIITLPNFGDERAIAGCRSEHQRAERAAHRQRAIERQREDSPVGDVGRAGAGNLGSVRRAR